MPSVWPLAGQRNAETAALCRKLRSDPLRPQFHLLPPSNWMNDPNGPIYFNGKYHLFYQFNPHAAVWGDMHWAHATSPDMVHWTHEPIALTPTPEGYDRLGVFSGSAVVNHGVPTVIYTGILPPANDAEATLRDGVHNWREVQCLATSSDPHLRTWQKLPEPVIATPPSGLAVTGFRDPCVWHEGDAWMLALGSGIRGKGGAVLLYTSRDLRHWTYLHPLIEGSPGEKTSAQPTETGDMWECPDFFPLGKKHVLLISTAGRVWWKVGTYKDQRLTLEREGVVDWGAYYAAKTMLDHDGNRILWGWIPEKRPEAEHAAAGWAGVMSLPRVLSLNTIGNLEFEPLPSMQQLRREPAEAKLPALKSLDISSLNVRNLAGEILLTVERSSDSFFALNFHGDGKDFASLVYDAPMLELRVNDMKAAVPLNPANEIQLHLFIDGSVLEVFVNKSFAMTARIYDVPGAPLKLSWQGAGANANLKLWQIHPISNNRLTSPICD